jgi:hypothetical protein
MHNSLTQPFSEADHLSSTFQIDFDRILCNNMENITLVQDFALRLGSIMRHRNAKSYFTVLPGIFASSYLRPSTRGGANP